MKLYTTETKLLAGGWKGEGGSGTIRKVLGLRERVRGQDVVQMRMMGE